MKQTQGPTPDEYIVRAAHRWWATEREAIAGKGDEAKNRAHHAAKMILRESVILAIKKSGK